MKSIRIFTPASVANVSCGFDVLGFCLEPIGDEMVIHKVPTKGVRITKIVGHDLPKNPDKNVASVAARSLLSDFPSGYGFEIEIYKNIKPGSGIGSSAASAAGAVFGINELLGTPLSRSGLLRYAMVGEALASGASHADNLAPVLLGGFTLVRSSKDLDVIKLPTPSELVVTIVHPKIELKTVYARAILKKNVSLENAVQQWGNLAAFVSALYTEDYSLLSRCIVDGIIEPYRSILIPEFEAIRNSAIEAGALGSGISGSGPSIYALSKGVDVAEKVAESMRDTVSKLPLEHEVYVSRINQTGIKILD